MKSSEIFGGFIFYCYLCINKKEQHYENNLQIRPPIHH